MATKETLMARTTQEGDCLCWTGHINRSGYGSVWHDGQNRDVHRVSFALHHGDIPAGMHVMHRCDNRRCINPAHLCLGTRQDNMTDMLNKGRHRCSHGIAHHNAKLTPEIAAEIRRRFVGYCRRNGARALSREFGVTPAAVLCVLKGATWAA